MREVVFTVHSGTRWRICGPDQETIHTCNCPGSFVEIRASLLFIPRTDDVHSFTDPDKGDVFPT